MTEIVVDCQNLPCPQPVLRCKAALDGQAPAAFAVIVDNEAALENVQRFLTSQGYAVQAVGEGASLWRVRATRAEAPAGTAEGCAIMTDEQLAAVTCTQKIVVFITSDTLGLGDDGLGARLMQAFTATLPELGSELWRIVLVNGGVKLTATPGPILENLQKLEGAGVDILVCGTCLDHFGLLKQKAVGQTTNMLDVVTSLQLATKVIRP